MFNAIYRGGNGPLPEFTTLGMRPLQHFDYNPPTDPSVPGAQKGGAPDVVAIVEGAAAAYKANPCADWYIDIEAWPTWDYDVSSDEAENSVYQIIELIQAFKRGAPGTKVGVYGIAPSSLFGQDGPMIGASADGKTTQRRLWQESQRIVKPIRDHIDYVFPCLYTYSQNLSWRIQAREVIDAAKRWGEGLPVYPFLYRQVMPDNPGTPVNADLWALELETCAARADGFVIWDNPSALDTSEPWYAETKEFLRYLP